MNEQSLANKILAFTDHDELTQFSTQHKEKITFSLLKILVKKIGLERLRNPRKAESQLQIGKYIVSLINTEKAYMLYVWVKGNIHYALTEYEQALSCFQEAEAYYSCDPNQTAAPVALQISQLVILSESGRYQEAIKLADIARQKCLSLIALSHDDTNEKNLRQRKVAERHLAALEVCISKSYRLIGDPKSALSSLNNARDILIKHDDLGAKLALTNHSIAETLTSMDRIQEAQALFIKNRLLCQQQNQVVEVARTDLCLGIIAHHQGLYQKALKLFEESYSGFQSTNIDIDLATVDLNRAVAYSNLSLNHESINLTVAASKIFKGKKHYGQYAHCLLLQGMGYKQLKQYDLAEKYFYKARRLMYRNSAWLQLYILDIERAELAMLDNRLATARRIAQRVQKKVDADTYPALNVRLKLLLAHIYIQEKVEKLTQTKTILEETLHKAKSFGLLEKEIQSLYLFGQLYENHEEWHKASQYYESAILQVEKVTQRLFLDDIHVSYMEDKLSIYDAQLCLTHALFLRQEKDANKLFLILNSLQTAPIKRTYQLQQAQHLLEPHMLERLKVLRQQWQWFQNQLTTTNLSMTRGFDKSSLNQHEIQVEQKSIEREISDIMRRQRVRATHHEQIVESEDNNLKKSLLSTVQANLDSQTAILQYYVVDDRLQLFLTLHNSHLVLSDVTTIKKLKRSLQLWQFYLDRNSYHTNLIREKAYLSQLYCELFSELENIIGQIQKIHLILPPDLNDIPFEALFDGENYLVERFQIERLSAPEIVLNQQTKGNQAERELPNNSNDSFLLIGNSDNERLPYTLQEVSKIASLLEPTQSVLTLKEEDATIAKFTHACQQAKLIHFASHAIFRPDNPLFSWIQMADGKLTVADLYQINLPQKPLIVLSACETGRGVSRGGGLIGMARGFLSAGASGLIVTLWQIVDEVSAKLLESFYRLFIEYDVELHKSALLRQVQIDAIAQELPASAWAGFIYIEG